MTTGNTARTVLAAPPGPALSRPRRLAAVVFDFDGTLAELTIDFGEMKQRVADLAAAYLPARPEPGPMPVLEWLDDLAAKLAAGDPSHGPDKAAELRERGLALVEAIERDAAMRGALFPYTRPVLRALAQAGVRTGIITRNCHAAVTVVFPDALGLCGCLLARDHVARVKPDPSHLLQALLALGCAPEEALMVGDHPMDIETGRKAGTWTAAVASGRVDLNELLARGPDYGATDCEALLDLLTTQCLL